VRRAGEIVVSNSEPESILRAAIRRAASRALGVEPEEIPLTYPPKPELGDLATPLCFELARRLKRAPRELAAAVVEAATGAEGIERLEVAGAGYINAFLDRRSFLERMLQPGEPPSQDGPKTIVEHTNINPNKAAHIGHLRNAVLGDTLVRFLRRLGTRVEVQNYIDDTGVQVADLVVGFSVLRGEGLEVVRERYSDERLRERGERFDYVAWDLYAEVTRYYEEDAEHLAHRRAALHAMESGEGELAALAAHVAGRMVRHHLLTMERIDVRYDLLPHESDILRLHFWDRAFEMLRESRAIHEVTTGKNAGCWVMDLPGVDEGAGEDQKVIRRSDGTVTYVGKDIAYQLWKFGLLGRDFHYTPFDWSAQEAPYELWSTCSEARDDDASPDFGGGATVYNVIDVRQSYLQRVVANGLRALGHERQAERSIHYAYEMVALTPAAVETLFPDHPLGDEDRTKPYLEMSGRKGLGVRADDLLDTMIRRAGDEVLKRHDDLCAAEVSEIAGTIAVGALRYYMLRYTRNRVVAFDLDAALAFEGETGPYLQYSVVRARNILVKVAERFPDAPAAPHELAAAARFASLGDAATEHWNLVLLLLRSDAVIRQAVESLELSTVAKHGYVLAQTFNSFYHRHPVAQERDETVRATRCAVVRAYRDRMTDLLELMGIGVPVRM
jgi:arginyl-tRNA synthetase